MRTNKKSVLLLTSTGADVKRSGGELSIAGLADVKTNEILAMRQIVDRAEVSQQVTVGTSSYTPTASTVYKIAIVDPLQKREGWTGSTHYVSYTTPVVVTTIGATAALQREAIHVALIAKINTGTKTYNATAVTLATGSGITITDNAGYYPANVNGGSKREGANTILAVTNVDGTGFASSDTAITVAAVYSFGEGTKLLADAPVIAAYNQQLVSGDLCNPKTVGGASAAAGQLYDVFLITALATSPAHAVGDQLAHEVQEFAAFVDNGEGTVTTNLAGFKSFEREMHKLVAEFNDAPGAVVEFFDRPFAIQGLLGGAPATTAGVLNTFATPYGSINHVNIGTQTIVSPTLGATGLLLAQDVTATEGAEYAPSYFALNDQGFTVGKTGYSVTARILATDWTDTDFVIGIKPKVAINTVIDNYTDLAVIGGGAADGDSIFTRGILNNAATVTTDTAVDFADGVSILLEIRVAVDGTVTALADGVEYPIYSVGATALVLDEGDEMIPFFRHVNIGSNAGIPVIQEFMAIPTADWKG